MILEARSIILSDDEVVLALRPLMEARGLDPLTQPREAIPELDGDGEVSVRYDMASKGSDIMFNSREVGAAILNHCIEQGIPLPRGSQKELAIRGDHLALIVRLETGAFASAIDETEE